MVLTPPVDLFVLKGMLILSIILIICLYIKCVLVNFKQQCIFVSLVNMYLIFFFFSRDSERKSLSTEQTFSEISRPTELYEKCSELCQDIADDLKEEKLMVRCFLCFIFKFVEDLFTYFFHSFHCLPVCVD